MVCNRLVLDSRHFTIKGWTFVWEARCWNKSIFIMQEVAQLSKAVLFFKELRWNSTNVWLWAREGDWDLTVGSALQGYCQGNRALLSLSLCHGCFYYDMFTLSPHVFSSVYTCIQQASSNCRLTVTDPSQYSSTCPSFWTVFHLDRNPHFHQGPWHCKESTIFAWYAYNFMAVNRSHFCLSSTTKSHLPEWQMFWFSCSKQVPFLPQWQ